MSSVIGHLGGSPVDSASDGRSKKPSQSCLEHLIDSVMYKDVIFVVDEIMNMVLSHTNIAKDSVFLRCNKSDTNPARPIMWKVICLQ